MQILKQLKLRNARRKRAFLLLEALIATFILSICLYLVLEPHISCLREELKLAKSLEYERLADLSSLEVLQSIYEKDPYPILNPLPVYFAKGKKMILERRYKVEVLRGQEEDHARLLAIGIVLLNHQKEVASYNYKFVIKETSLS